MKSRNVYRPVVRKLMESDGYHIEIIDKELNSVYIINVIGGIRNCKGDYVHRISITGIDEHIRQLTENQRKLRFEGFAVRLTKKDEV